MVYILFIMILYGIVIPKIGSFFYGKSNWIFFEKSAILIGSSLITHFKSKMKMVKLNKTNCTVV